MKVVMINDCAFVGETLLKYLPNELEKQHIKRTRKFFDKTFGLAYNILKAKGDIYHVHYLLQDCYIASKLGKKPLVGHAHGSDLRQQINSKKWGWIVKHNLKSCDKILVAQPTILDIAKEYNNSSEYFPIPYDTKTFYPKLLQSKDKIKNVFLASPHNFEIKGTQRFLYALVKINIPIKIKAIWYGKDVEETYKLTKKLNLNVEFIKKVPHDKMNELYWDSDLVLGSYGIGQLDTVAIEAMACGRPVIHHINKKFYKDCPLEEINSIDECITLIEKFLIDEKSIKKRIEEQAEYVKTFHAAPILVKRLLNIYEELIK